MIMDGNNYLNGLEIVAERREAERGIQSLIQESKANGWRRATKLIVIPFGARNSKLHEVKQEFLGAVQLAALANGLL